MPFLISHLLKFCKKNLEVALIERDDLLQQTISLKSFYESILDHSPAKIAVIDPDLIIRYVNELMIYKDPVMADAIGKSFIQLSKSYPKVADRLNNLSSFIAKAIENKKLIQFEESIISITGENRTILRSILPYYIEDVIANMGVLYLIIS